MDKSTLLKILKQKKFSNPPASSDVIIFDGSFIYHAMTDVSLSFGNISEKNISIVTSPNVHTVIIVFDRCFSPSIRARFERQNRRLALFYK